MSNNLFNFITNYFCFGCYANLFHLIIYSVKFNSKRDILNITSMYSIVMGNDYVYRNHKPINIFKKNGTLPMDSFDLSSLEIFSDSNDSGQCSSNALNNSTP